MNIPGPSPAVQAVPSRVPRRRDRRRAHPLHGRFPLPVRHDPLLCRGLAGELNERHAGRRTDRLLLDRERRAATLGFRDGPGLLFLLHPETGQLLETPGSVGETRLNLRGLRLTRAGAPLDERLLVLELPPDGEEGTPHRLVLELMTNQWNLLLLRRGGTANGEETGAWRIRAALWRREAGDRVLRGGHPYRPPRGDRRWREDAPSVEAWRDLLGDVPPDERRGTALREVAWLSSVNVDWVLGAAAGTGEEDPGAAGDSPEGAAGSPEGAAGSPEATADAERPDGTPGTAGSPAGEPTGGDGPDPLEAARRRYVSLREAEREAWLLDRGPGLQPYVHPLGREDASRAPSLLAGMAASLRREEGWRQLAGLAAEHEEEPEPPELTELREALEGREARLRRRVEALERELEEGEDPEDLRETANLILARLGEVPRGESSAELEDFDGGRRTVELDPTLSPSENADRYYERAKKRERAREKIPAEIRRARRERERVEEARRGLGDRTGAPGEEEADRLWELAGGRPEERGPSPEEEQRLPYRVLETSGGLEVRVGKGAKSNEELTFHHSHTEDVWMHARQVPGAHVILRWGHREGNPPKRDLLEAAVAAAVHSDARHSGTVAVDWTRRKYVRSPRKSPPGLVVPRNIQTVFVEPDEAVVRTMRRRVRG